MADFTNKYGASKVPLIPAGDFPITFAKYIDFDGIRLDKAIEDIDIPQYTLAEYEAIKDSIEPGTAFIIKDDGGESQYYIKAPETATAGQLLAVKAVDSQGRPTEWKAVDFDYEQLKSKPKINGVTIDGNLSLSDLKIQANIPEYTLAEYEVIKETIPPGTLFIINDDWEDKT